MSQYQWQINQVADYPRRRIQKQFIRTLMEDRSIRMSGGSGLFCFAVLYSFASPCHDLIQIERGAYHVSSGEHVCSSDEMMSWFRIKKSGELLEILNSLCDAGLIDYKSKNHGGHYWYRILLWPDKNSIYEHRLTCEEESEFLFIPKSILRRSFYYKTFSEADIILDLLMNSKPNLGFEQFAQFKAAGYGNYGDSLAMTNYDSLSMIWDMPKDQVKAALQKLEQLGYISIIQPAISSSGVVICLNVSTTTEKSEFCCLH